MAYLVRALPALGTTARWQYIGRRVTRKAAENLAGNTVRALGRAVCLVNERTNDTLQVFLPNDCTNDTDWRAEQDAKHITPEGY